MTPPHPLGTNMIQKNIFHYLEAITDIRKDLDYINNILPSFITYFMRASSSREEVKSDKNNDVDYSRHYEPSKRKH